MSEMVARWVHAMNQVSALEEKLAVAQARITELSSCSKCGGPPPAPRLCVRCRPRPYPSTPTFGYVE